MEQFDNFKGADESVNCIQTKNCSVLTLIEPARNVYVKVTIQLVRIELDSGTTHTVISERIWEGIRKPVLAAPPNITAYGAFTLPVL